MKTGDLVKYIPTGYILTGGDTLDVELVGVLVDIDCDGYHKVYWTDGTIDEDLICSELEVLCK